MRERKRIKNIIILIFLFANISMISGISFAQSEADAPYLIESLKDKTITWRITNSSGVYVNEETQPGDLIRYEVDDVDVNNELYTIEPERKPWSQDDFIEQDYERPTYYLIRRRWGSAAVDYFVKEDAEFWGGEDRVMTYYKVEYFTEWVNGFLINTIQISFIMNKTNFDIIKYTRSEGIMLSRKAVVNCCNGTRLGYLKIDFESYSGLLISSPWYYVIIIAVIIGIVAVVMVIISTLIKRRKRMWQEIEEI